MRINVNFTIEVRPEDLPALRELAAADNNQDAIGFVRGDAQQYTLDYLTSNGVRATVLRDAATTY
jgi:hypothetical protein